MNRAQTQAFSSQLFSCLFLCFVMKRCVRFTSGCQQKPLLAQSPQTSVACSPNVKPKSNTDIDGTSAQNLHHIYHFCGFIPSTTHQERALSGTNIEILNELCTAECFAARVKAVRSARSVSASLQQWPAAKWKIMLFIRALDEIQSLWATSSGLEEACWRAHMVAQRWMSVVTRSLPPAVLRVNGSLGGTMTLLPVSFIPRSAGAGSLWTQGSLCSRQAGINLPVIQRASAARHMGALETADLFR